MCKFFGRPSLLAITCCSQFIISSCERHVERTELDEPRLTIAGAWVSHYSEDVYDLPCYWITFDDAGRFEGKYHGGWNSGKLTGTYVWDGSVATLVGTNDNETRDPIEFKMKLKAEGGRLVEQTTMDFHLIFVRE